MKKQSLDCNRSIIYLLCGRGFQLISNLAAVSVYTISDSVNKAVFFFVYAYRWQLVYIIFTGKGVLPAEYPKSCAKSLPVPMG